MTLQFGFGSALLTPAARASIDQAAERSPKTTRIAISGRTDNVGPLQANENLALARANAVQEHLRKHHPRLAAIAALDAKGACCFAAPNDTPDGRARNRRVEIVFEQDTEDL